MASSFTIPKSAYAGLNDLIAMGRPRLERLAAVVIGQELTLDVEMVAASLSEPLECDKDGIERAIASALIPMCSLRARLRMSPADFLQQFGEWLREQNPAWHQANREEWLGIAPALVPLIAPDGYFNYLCKAFELLGNRPGAVQELKILTEVQPVYDEDAAEIKALVLTNTLLVRFTDGKAKQVHLTLDQQDLRTLQEQLDQVGKKAQALEQLAANLSVSVLRDGA